MPTVTLNPASIIAAADWNTGGTTASEMDQGNTTVWIGNTNTTAKISFELDDFNVSGVASIDSVTSRFVAFFGNSRSGVVSATTRLNNGASPLWSEVISVTVNGGAFATYDGTTRTTTDGSTPWSDAVIDALRLEVFFATPPPGNVYVMQMFVMVAYTEETGYGNSVSGIASANVGTIDGIPTANINKVIGV